MLKDIKDILKENSTEKLELPLNHRQRFENRLQKLEPKKAKNYIFLKIAASILVLISVGYFLIQNNSIETAIPDEKIDLATISPELKQIENNYITAINYEMLGIEATEDNKEILDAYLEKVALLSEEYNALSKKLITDEINENTVNALINNLQLRLQLLLELKDKLTELKTNKTLQNETNTI
ncbi:hypothetical protein UMM65_07960 [Aureibaculum sp. 2210JD6-5]|uniref:hypothetical protein n=1 Tax=Aureibaculum sp. 2210JD6-5 TaxID=3103957 RepID=UPI002AAC6EF6|nr:hypothetical protein [Aureibaculum sp. 2210JD6-5]MDY7395174.1 hypothetical protein [Aureibaculum sp. 2210JD6-5]